MQKDDYIFTLTALISNGNLSKNEKRRVSKLLEDLESKTVAKKTNKKKDNPQKRGRKERKVTAEEAEAIRQKMRDGISMSQLKREYHMGFYTLKKIKDIPV